MVRDVLSWRGMHDFGPDAPDFLYFNSQTGVENVPNHPIPPSDPNVHFDHPPICPPQSTSRRWTQRAGDWVMDHLIPGAGSDHPHQHYCD